MDLRGVNRDTGCIVVIRPDQYVSHVLPLHGYPARRPGTVREPPMVVESGA